MENQDQGKSATGIKPNIAALLCYAVGWVTGLVFYLLEKENKFVRFHALQSMCIFGALSALSIAAAFLPVIGVLLIPIVSILELVLWIILMVKAYQGEMFKLPIAGDFAEKNA